jgi:hypothetical protein
MSDATRRWFSGCVWVLVGLGASGSAALAQTGAEAAASAPGRAAAALRVVPATLDFGEQGLSAPAAQRMVTLSPDEAGAALGTHVLQASGDFSVAPARCELVAGGSCALAVSFTPKRAGLAEGALSVSGSASGPTRVLTTLRGQGVADCTVLGFAPCSRSSVQWIVGLVLLYAIAVLCVRWNLVARPSWEHLQSRIAALRARMHNLPDAPVGGGPTNADIAKLLSQAEPFVKGQGELSWLLDRVFWSRGRELAGWRLLHDAKEMLVARATPQQIRVELESAEKELRESGGALTLALAEQIKTELARDPIDITDLPAAALRELQRYLARAAAVVQADITRALNSSTTPAPTADGLKTLADRLVAALMPPATLPQDLGAAAALPTTAPEWAQLLRHARDVLLPSASKCCAAIKTALAATPALDERGWSAVLGAWKSDHLPLATALSERLGVVLAAAPLAPSERRVALLKDALACLYQANDDDYDGHVTWHRKSMWLMVCALMLVLVLALTLGHALLFLMGALGGLLSRLSRAITGEGVPNEYGAYWTTLFLSPVAGALTGWGGALLVTLGVKLGVLGAALAPLGWDGPVTAVLLATALLFGGAERLFLRLLENIEPKVAPAGKESKTEKDDTNGTKSAKTT